MRPSFPFLRGLATMTEPMRHGLDQLERQRITAEVRLPPADHRSSVLWAAAFLALAILLSAFCVGPLRASVGGRQLSRVWLAPPELTRRSAPQR